MTNRGIQWFRWLSDALQDEPRPTDTEKQKFYNWFQDNKPENVQLKGEHN